MATAEEKQALGLSPDASEADITARITELTEGRDQLEEQIRTEREARAEAENAKTASESEAGELRRLTQQLRDAQTAPSDTTGATPSVAAHTVAQVTSKNRHNLFDVPDGNSITIKIRAFPYYVDIEDPITMRPMRTEQIATRGMTVKVSDTDYRRAVKFDSIYSPEELAAREEAQGRELDLSDASVADVSTWLQIDKPSIPVILDEVNNDAENAQKVLDAENHATGGQPREELVDELEEIING